MRQMITMILIVSVVILGGQRSSFPQRENNPNQSKQVEQFVVLAEKRLELGSEFSRVARLKLASRKATYHIGEMINLDIALLNISNQPIFFRKLSDIELYAHNKKGSEVSIAPYIEASSIITPKSFHMLQLGEMITETTQVLVGCNKQAFKNINMALDENSDGRIFEQNLFVSWGDRCLDVRHLGTYTLIAEEKNDYVVVSSDGSNIQTAIGSIKSDSLTITVAK